ncbi:MAG TPA: hypothetical protein VLM91_15815 [Candidatus Methylomirabilis sp.]|nr:hypothetical protein [Candidatus Methylomirabilis sp.]
MPVKPESRDTVAASLGPEALPGSISREISYQHDSLPSRIATLNSVNVLDAGVSLRSHRQMVENLWQIRRTVPLTRT